MNFHYFKPSDILANYIKQYWVLEAMDSEGEICERVIPTGNIELMFHYKKPFMTKNLNDSSEKQPRSFISGISSTYSDISTCGDSGMIAVTFFPAGASNFFIFPMLEIENTTVDLCDIYGERFRLVEEEIGSALNLPQKISIIERFLLEKLSPVHKNDLSLIREGVTLINQSKGQIGNRYLADKLCLSPKSMERKFSDLLGKTPKQFIRIVRFQEVLKDLAKDDPILLTEFAHKNGYFDQAHFIKDFKSLSGYTPKEFRSKFACRSDYAG